MAGALSHCHRYIKTQPWWTSFNKMAGWQESTTTPSWNLDYFEVEPGAVCLSASPHPLTHPRPALVANSAWTFNMTVPIQGAQGHSLRCAMTIILFWQAAIAPCSVLSHWVGCSALTPLLYSCWPNSLTPSEGGCVVESQSISVARMQSWSWNTWSR